MIIHNTVCLRAGIILMACLSVSCAHHQTTSHVVIGESFATGAEAAQELQLAINRAQTVGCRAISVGGYGAGGEGMVIGIAALMSCPKDIDLIPTGFPYDKNGQKIPVDPAVVVPPTIPP